MPRGLGVVTLATFALSACSSSGPAVHRSAVTLGWGDKSRTVSVAPCFSAVHTCAASAGRSGTRESVPRPA